MSSLKPITFKTSRGCFKQPRARLDYRIHAYPRGFESTTIDDAHHDPSPLRSVLEDYSDESGDPVMFPSSKSMGAHCYRLEPRSQYQSPAKVFAKLKAGVGRNTGGMQTFEKYGSVPLTLKKGTDHRPDENWITHDTNTFDSNSAEALTISPTLSPQHKQPKSFSNPYRDTSSVKGTRHGLVDRSVFTPMKTCGQVSSQLLLSHNATPSTSSYDIVRTLTKGQQQQPLHAEFGRRTRLEPLESPAKIFANMKRERHQTREHCFKPKRRWINTAHDCQSVRALNGDGRNEVDLELPGDESQSLISVDPSERDPCSLDEPTNHLLVNDVRYDQSPSARSPVISQDLWHHASSNAFPSKSDDLISLENLMSPAAKFSHMKERKIQQLQEADPIRSNTNDRRTAGCEVPSRKQPGSTDQEGIKYGPHMNAWVHLQRICLSDRFQPEGTRDLFESSCKDDTPVPALNALVEDPLVIQSPHVFFPPKTTKSIFKRNPASEEQNKPQKKGGGYELAKWTIKFTREGLYVDGIRTVDNIPWHSTIIVERISQCVLKTSSGRTYTLIGKMKVDEASKLPKWFLNKFVKGFPVNWKMHFQDFLSAAKTETSSDSKARQTKCPVSAKSTLKIPDKKQRSPPFVTPFCPPPALNVSSFGLKTSRSGRLIKPPLEFWKGGRVSVDASMNVTIHEDYGTTVCMSPPKQHGAVVWRYGEVFRSSESTVRPVVDQQPLALQRKVKHRSRKQRAQTHQPPKDQIYPAAQRQPRAASSSPEVGGRGRSLKRPRSTRQVSPETGCDSGRHKPTEHGLERADSEGRKAVAMPHSTATLSDEEVIVRRKGKKKGPPAGGGTTLSDETVTSKGRGKGRSPPPKPAPAPTSATQRGDHSTSPQTLREEESWTEEEFARLKEAVASLPKQIGSYWVNVAMMVGTRSPEECQMKLTFKGCVNISSKKAKASKESTAAKEPSAITARVGTLKRKQQVRQFMEAMPKDDHGDVFSSSSMQSKRFKMLSMSPSGKEQGFVVSDLEPITPRGARYFTVKTPPCPHVTPGMTGSVTSKNDDKYNYHLQKRMKRRQVHAGKLSPTKNFTLTPSIKQKMRKRGNMDDNSFVIREMFPDNNGFHDDSGEEEDLYFTDSN